MSETSSLEKSFRSELADIGITDGDFVMAHSRVGTAPLPEVLECLNALIGSVEPTGTLAIPTFNFGFCRGVEPVNYVSHILERFDHYKQYVVARRVPPKSRGETSFHFRRKGIS